MGRSARIMVLRAAAGMVSTRDMYILNCGFRINRTSKAQCSSIRSDRLVGFPTKWQVPDWEQRRSELGGNLGLSRRVGAAGITEYDIAEKWFFTVLKQKPALHEELIAPFIFHSNAPEMCRIPGVRARTYTLCRHHVMEGRKITSSGDDGLAPGCVPPTY